jgi:arabinogalactan oligomer/maltooligosaccharide transport system permease protein
MSSISDAQPLAIPHAVEKVSPPRRSASHGMWWRHGLAVLALIWALFPIVFIVSAALNPSGTLNTAELLPKNMSMTNFDALFADTARPYLTWYKNSMIIAGFGSLASVFIGACAAYAFSRMRFTGRRPGLLALLLLQMFPALLAFVALYITFDSIGNVLPAFGLNTSPGLILAYLGGAMGANVWLLKGYFDTVPRELDEAAKVDGASHARIFFTMTLRLVMPILVTVFMLSFVGLFSEFLLASIFLQGVDSQTLGVGLWAMQKSDKNKYFGQFCAGAILASLPVVLLYLGFQKQLVGGLTQGSVK